MKRTLIAVTLVATLMVSSHSAWAGDIGVHAKLGGMLGKRSGNAREAFFKGFASHIAFDYVIYGSVVYSEGEFVNDETIPLTVAVNIIELRQTWKYYKKTKDKKFLNGALGAMAPDLIEVVNKFVFGRDKFIFGWHNRQSTLLINEPTSAPGVSKRANLINAGIGVVVYQLKF
jgi:hypothetical protein